jgi:hypothetical protein
MRYSGFSATARIYITPINLVRFDELTALGRDHRRDLMSWSAPKCEIAAKFAVALGLLHSRPEKSPVQGHISVTIHPLWSVDFQV